MNFNEYLNIIESLSVFDSSNNINRFSQLIHSTTTITNDYNNLHTYKNNRNKIYNQLNNKDINDYNSFKDHPPPEVTTLSSTLEVQSNSLRPAVSSFNYLSLKSRATPGDRGEESETIHGSRGEVNREATTASGMESGVSTGPQVEPGSDLRELEGEVKGRGSTPSGRVGVLEDIDWTSSGLPGSDLRELEGEINKGADGMTSSGMYDIRDELLEDMIHDDGYDIDSYVCENMECRLRILDMKNRIRLLEAQNSQLIINSCTLYNTLMEHITNLNEIIKDKTN